MDTVFKLIDSALFYFRKNDIAKLLDKMFEVREIMC